MGAPLAYFITWTVAGTWLHGDERGSINHSHNLVGHPGLAPNPALAKQERESMETDAILLSPSMRETVVMTIREHCVIRKWDLLAANARTNHVHIVVRADALPETVMGQFKAWSSRRLAEKGFVARGTKVWTRHGSTRWINRHEDLAAAIDYVTRLQDHPGRFLPMPRDDKEAGV